jgi:hypothetical protein
VTSQPPLPTRAHPWHAFDGMRILDGPRSSRLIVARCACGEVIDVADAVFAACADHAGPGCPRCAGSGEVVDHRALAWRPATPDELAAIL